MIPSYEIFSSAAAPKSNGSGFLSPADLWRAYRATWHPSITLWRARRRWCCLRSERVKLFDRAVRKHNQRSVAVAFTGLDEPWLARPFMRRSGLVIEVAGDVINADVFRFRQIWA